MAYRRTKGPPHNVVLSTGGSLVSLGLHRLACELTASNVIRASDESQVPTCHPAPERPVTRDLQSGSPGPCSLGPVASGRQTTQPRTAWTSGGDRRRCALTNGRRTRSGHRTGCWRSKWPDVDARGDERLEEVYDTERHWLCVACTRVRDHLLVTGVNPASEFLEDLRG
jgi:hypothetical protein